MKYIISLILLITIILVCLVRCQNKEKDMKTKFKWQETISCPLGYPVDVYRGGLQDADGGFSSLYLGTHSGNGGWGSLGATMSSGIKKVPNHLHVIWVSHAENIFYEIDTDIDYEKMLELFNKGYYFPSIGDNPQPRKENYDSIIVGFAPGGVVVIWLEGLGRQIEIGRYQAEKVVIQQEEIDGLNPPISHLFNPEYSRKIMYEFKIVPLEVVKANENKPIPYGVWDTYRKRYNWKLRFDSPDEVEIKETYFFLYNGERENLFGSYLFEKYPNIIPIELKLDFPKIRVIPDHIRFKWIDSVSNNEYWGNIGFNEQEIFKAFDEVFGESADKEAELIIRVNELKTYATVVLRSKDKEVWLTENKITINKQNK